MPHKILIIDDEPGYCDVLQYSLLKEGYEVNVAYSAVDALEMDLKDYSLFLVDVNMDIIDGMQFVDIISKKEDTRYIPVIFCTCRSEEEMILNGFDLGADDYITKPFDTRTVLRRVKAVLNRCYPEISQQNNQNL